MRTLQELNDKELQEIMARPYQESDTYVLRKRVKQICFQLESDNQQNTQLELLKMVDEKIHEGIEDVVATFMDFTTIEQTLEDMEWFFGYAIEAAVNEGVNAGSIKEQHFYHRYIKKLLLLLATRAEIKTYFEKINRSGK